MKKAVYSFVFFLISLYCFSQDFPTYNSIMGIESHIVTDDFSVVFDIDSFEYPIEFTETILEDDIATTDRTQKKINSQTTYKLNKLGLIEEEKIKSSWLSIDLTRKFFYDDKGKLTKVQFFEGEKAVNEYNSYLYHDNRVIKEITNFAKGSINKKTFAKLDENRYQWETDKAIQTYFIVSTYGKKVRSIKTKNKQTGEEFEIKYGFYTNSYGQNDKITYQTKGIEKEYTFNPNKINRLSKVVTTNLETEKKAYKFYTYLNDDYGNWIIKYKNGEGEELFDNSDQVTIRQLKYPDGTVTGFIDPKNTEFREWLQDYYFKNFRKKMSDKEVIEDYSWKKNEDGSSYWFTINGEDTAKQSLSFYIGNDLIVVNKTTREIFNCKDFKTKSANTFHKADKIDIDISLGFWYKFMQADGKENFSLANPDGSEYDYNLIEKLYSDSNGNSIVLKKDGSKIVLENAKSVSVGIIQPIVNFDNSKHLVNNSNNAVVSNKPYEEESDYTWKKNEAGAYWFYKNYEAINNSKSFWNGNDLLVLDPNNNNLINLKGYKQGEPNITYKGYKLNVDITDGIWFKTAQNQFMAYDRNGNHIAELEINKWEDNKKDIIIKSKNSPKTYVLPGYSTAEINKVYSLKVEGYEKSTSNVYDKAAEALKTQTESVIKMAESMDEVYKKVAGECFKGNCNDGYGEKKWSSGNVAEAFFEKGKPFGPGLLIYKDGNQKFANFNGSWDNVEGFEFIDFKNNKAAQFINHKTKMGIYYDQKNNEFWELQIVAKSKTLLEPNNDKYCLVGNCQNGTGLYKYSNDVTYFGTFRNGRRHGFGDLRFPNGQYYIGEFNNDIKEGHGFYVWSDDKYYSGQWRNDTYHGKGIMSYSKTNYQAGLWENGKYVRSLDTKN